MSYNKQIMQESINILKGNNVQLIGPKECIKKQNNDLKGLFTKFVLENFSKFGNVMDA